jgi:hypothetical protein
MTFFRKLSTSKPSYFWISALVFLSLLIHGALLGLSDDEAYYWVLAQKPDWAYAFHPPAVAWTMAFFQKLLFGMLPRFPAALISGVVCAMGIHWMKLSSSRLISDPASLSRGGWVLVAFAGMFGASWMMVPDLPLILGWMILFVAVWKLCFTESRNYVALFTGAFLLLLSKYSGVLAVGSAALCVLFWSSKEVRLKGLAALVAGALAALIPVLIWNSQHEWASLLYQVRDRHGGASFSGARYLRFWVIQLVLAGPAVFYFFFRYLPVLAKARHESFPSRRRARYVALWIAPAFLVFCFQPAWSDFKAHWSLVVWLPLFLEFGASVAESRPGETVRKWGSAQLSFGLPLLLIALLFCHVPAISWITEKMTGKTPDPKWDVSNDMYGWDQLQRFIQRHPEYQDVPVIGGRYQTASQAAYALRREDGRFPNVAFIPRDLKQKDEWPDLNVTSHSGPDWPVLLKKVLFVADGRYDAGPEFKNSKCVRLEGLTAVRWGYASKTILLWECTPN